MAKEESRLLADLKALQATREIVRKREQGNRAALAQVYNRVRELDGRHELTEADCAIVPASNTFVDCMLAIFDNPMTFDPSATQGISSGSTRVKKRKTRSGPSSTCAGADSTVTKLWRNCCSK